MKAIVTTENPRLIKVSVELGENRREMRRAKTNPEAAHVAHTRFPLRTTKRPPKKAPPRYPAVIKMGEGLRSTSVLVVVVQYT
jgi:hypothetical protein